MCHIHGDIRAVVEILFHVDISVKNPDMLMACPNMTCIFACDQGLRASSR